MSSSLESTVRYSFLPNAKKINIILKFWVGSHVLFPPNPV